MKNKVKLFGLVIADFNRHSIKSLRYKDTKIQLELCAPPVYARDSIGKASRDGLSNES